jgi:hypothetical protein
VSAATAEIHEEIEMAELKRSSTKNALVDKVLIPLAAAGASAAGGYLARKAPAFVERTLLPKLREAGSSSAPRDVAQTLVDRAQSVAKKVTPRDSLSADELEKRRREREQRRAQRRKATTT